VNADGTQHDAALIVVSPTESLAVAAHATDAGSCPHDHVAPIFHPPRT
jgi:hypothetical protein